MGCHRKLKRIESKAVTSDNGIKSRARTQTMLPCLPGTISMVQLSTMKSSTVGTSSVISGLAMSTTANSVTCRKTQQVEYRIFNTTLSGEGRRQHENGIAWFARYAHSIWRTLERPSDLLSGSVSCSSLLLSPVVLLSGMRPRWDLTLRTAVIQ